MKRRFTGGGAEFLESFERHGVNAHLGLRLDRLTVRGATCSLTVGDQHLQGYGVVQGGVVSALADAAAVVPLIASLAIDEGVTSIEFKVNFLAPALPGRGRLVARSRVLRRGRRVALCDVDVRQGRELVAQGLFTYLFSPLPAPR